MLVTGICLYIFKLLTLFVISLYRNEDLRIKAFTHNHLTTEFLEDEKKMQNKVLSKSLHSTAWVLILYLQYIKVPTYNYFSFCMQKQILLTLWGRMVSTYVAVSSVTSQESENNKCGDKGLTTSITTKKSLTI